MSSLRAWESGGRWEQDSVLATEEASQSQGALASSMLETFPIDPLACQSVGSLTQTS